MKKNKIFFGLSRRKFNLFMVLNLLFFSIYRLPINKSDQSKKIKKVKHKKDIWFLNEGD